MSNKQFKVMVVPRWFTITPETVNALAYVYDYHVRDMPAFLNPNVLNITEALRAKLRLEGIVQTYSVLDKTRWDYIQGCTKFANPNPMGYWSGFVSCDNADRVGDFTGGVITDSSTGLSYLVNDIYLKDQDKFVSLEPKLKSEYNFSREGEVGKCDWRVTGTQSDN